MSRNINPDKMVFLGHDKWVKSDAIIAVEPLESIGRYWQTDGNSNKLRTRVLIAHAENEILASRTAQTILKDLTDQDKISTGQTLLKGMLDNPILSDSDFLTEAEVLERGNILKALNEHDNIKAVIEALPYQATKFYKLVNKYNIDYNQSRKGIDTVLGDNAPTDENPSKLV